MKQPNLTRQRIFLFALIIAICGLISEGTSFLTAPSISMTPWFRVFNGILSTIQLNFFNSFWFGSLRQNSFQYFSYLDTGAYVLLLAGALLYWFSAGKETRFIRFVLSIALFSTALSVVTQIIGNPFLFTSFRFWNYWILSWILSILKNAFVAWLCWSMLMQLQRDKSMDEEILADGESNYYVGAEASRWQRCFHLVLDLLLMFALLSFLLSMTFISKFVVAISYLAGEQASLALLMVVGRSIYYLFFETLLGATPAKLLTENRVLTDVGQQPSFNTILTRTLARQIPFNTFSYFGSRGWHDSISKTIVVKEIRTGASGIKYLLLVPTIVVAGVSIYYINDEIRKNKKMRAAKMQYDEKMQGLKNELERLSSSSFLLLNEVPYGSDKQIVLKVDSMQTDSILVRFFKFSPLEASRYKTLEFAAASARFFPTKMLSKKDVYSAITNSFDDYQQRNINSAEFFGDQKRYEINQVITLNSPNLTISHSMIYGDDGKFSMQFYNSGAACSLTNIQVLKGTLQFTTALPKTISTWTDSETTFMLYGERFNSDEHYQVKLTLEGSNKQPVNYLITGIGHERTMQKEFK